MTIIDPDSIAAWAVGIPSILVVIAYGYSIIRRRISADLKALEQDKSYTDMLEMYKNERDDIREERDRVVARMTVLEQERNEAIGKVGNVTAEIEFLSTHVKELKLLIEKIGTGLESLRTEVKALSIDNAKLFTQVTCLSKIVERRKAIRSHTEEAK